MEINNPVKHLFMTLSQGVYVIGVVEEGQRNGFTASSVMQVSLQPPMLAVAVNPDNASYPLLVESGIFTVCVLPTGSEDLAELFGNHSVRDADKLARIGWHGAPSGAPILDEAVSYFDCRIVSRHPAGDHIIVVAEVTGGDFLHRDERPLLYSELGDLDGSAEMMPRRLASHTPAQNAG